MKIAIPLLATAVLTLSGCAINEHVSTIFTKNCLSDASKRTASVDWGKAETIDLKLEQDQYTPFTINLTKGHPYVLRIRNAEKSMRSFKAREFFKSIALAGVKLGGKTHDNTLPIRFTPTPTRARMGANRI